MCIRDSSQTVDKVAKTRRVIIIVIEAISYSKDDSCQSKTQNSYHPVSYTHLDVYKRQDSIDTNGLALEEYTKDLFLGVVSKALYDACLLYTSTGKNLPYF